MHRVVILGGGFGGLYAAQALKRAPVEVTVVDRRNFHLFQPLLYQVATGALSPGDIAAPIRGVLAHQANTRVLMAAAVDLDAGGRKLILSDGGELPYDTLLVSTGVENDYFGKNEWEPFAPGLKTVEDATEMRKRILFAFEQAERETDPARRIAWLTFVVVGAGPTGVELAGAVSELARDTLKFDFRSIDPRLAQVIIVDANERVLGAFHPKMSKLAEPLIHRLGILARTGVRVTNIDETGVDLQTPRGTDRIAARTVLWAAGIRGSGFARILAERAGATLERSGRVVVPPELIVPGHPEIFVIGDLAYREEKGEPLPGVAPVAMQQAKYVAGVIQSRLKNKPYRGFQYFNKGTLAVIGRARAVADLGFYQMGGLVAWLAWAFIHLLFIIEFQNRFIIGLRWLFEFVTFNRSARLITGEPTVRESRPRET